MLLIFVTLHIHHSFLISATSYFFSCAFLNAHVSAPYTSADLTSVLYTFPLTFTFIFMSHNTPDTLVQFFHPLCTQWATSASSFPSSENVDPMYVVFTRFTVSPSKWISSSCCSLHPMYSVFVLLIFNPRSSVALLHLSCFLSACSMLVLHSTIVCKQLTTRGLLFDA